jgi:hypothetical protein
MGEKAKMKPLAPHALVIKVLASLAAIVLLLVHLFLPEVRIDETTIYLLIIAIVPWLVSIFDTFELPGGWKVTFRAMQDKQQQQETDIATLKFLIAHFLTDAERIQLTKLDAKDPFLFKYAPSFERELRHLRDLNFIIGLPDKGFGTLKADDGGDVKNHFAITELGREYLALRGQAQSEAPPSGDT